MPGYIGGDFEGAAGGKACHSRWVQDAAGLGDRGEFSVFYQKVHSVGLLVRKINLVLLRVKQIGQ